MRGGRVRPSRADLVAHGVELGEEGLARGRARGTRRRCCRRCRSSSRWCASRCAGGGTARAGSCPPGRRVLRTPRSSASARPRTGRCSSSTGTSSGVNTWPRRTSRSRIDGRHREPVAREHPEELVVERRLVQQLGAACARAAGSESKTSSMRGVLVAEQELDGTVLVRLESGRRGQELPELDVLRRGQGAEHRPLLGQLELDLLHSRRALERRVQVVGPHRIARRAQLVEHQLEPELRGLVLDDEQQLVVMGGARCADAGRPAGRRARDRCRTSARPPCAERTNIATSAERARYGVGIRRGRGKPQRDGSRR